MKNNSLRILRIAAYNIATTLILLTLLESFVRLTYPDIRPAATSRALVEDSVYGNSAGLHPLASGFSDGEIFSVDALGFWKYSARPASGKNGWLLLGDSVTMGAGVDPDSTFAGRLAALCPAWQILNPSWIGYSSADYVNLASVLLQKGRPMPAIQRVTILWTLNDVYSHSEIGLPPGQTIREYASPTLGWIRQHYRTYFWLKRMLFDRPRDYYQFDRQFYKHGDPRFMAALADLDSIRSLCAEAAVELDVVMLPYEYQLRKTDTSTFHPQAVLSRALDSLGIRWHDASPALLGWSSDPALLYRFGDGIHFSSRGHGEACRYISKEFCREGGNDEY